MKILCDTDQLKYILIEYGHISEEESDDVINELIHQHESACNDIVIVNKSQLQEDRLLNERDNFIRMTHEYIKCDSHLDYAKKVKEGPRRWSTIGRLKPREKDDSK